MNKALLKSYMARNGDTQAHLASVLGLSLSRLNAKINETGGAEFKQTEIAFIKDRYCMVPAEIVAIFLSKNCLKKTYEKCVHAIFLRRDNSSQSAG